MKQGPKPVTDTCQRERESLTRRRQRHTWSCLRRADLGSTGAGGGGGGGGGGGSERLGGGDSSFADTSSFTISSGCVAYLRLQDLVHLAKREWGGVGGWGGRERFVERERFRQGAREQERASEREREREREKERERIKVLGGERES